MSSYVRVYFICRQTISSVVCTSTVPVGPQYTARNVLSTLFPTLVDKKTETAFSKHSQSNLGEIL